MTPSILTLSGSITDAKGVGIAIMIYTVDTMIDEGRLCIGPRSARFINGDVADQNGLMEMECLGTCLFMSMYLMGYCPDNIAKWQWRLLFAHGEGNGYTVAEVLSATDHCKRASKLALALKAVESAIIPDGQDVPILSLVSDADERNQLRDLLVSLFSAMRCHVRLTRSRRS